MKESDTDSTSFSASFRTFSSNTPSSEMMIIDQTSRTKKLADSRLSLLTINKLKIQSIGLVGREKEKEILQQRLRPLIQQANATTNNAKRDSSSDTSLPISKIKKELVFIKGRSGVGKTSLARVLEQEVNSTKNGFFVEGKFDFDDSKDEPYSGIAKAYSQLMRELYRSDRDVMLGIGRKLCEMLGTEVAPLAFLIPALENVVTEYSASSNCSDCSMDGMQERWKHSFRVLTRLLASHVKPLVILVDDLQWADKASLDLVECLITDSQNVNPLMVIGCYRSNEVNETCDLSNLIRSLMEEKAKFGLNITEVALESCGAEEVNQMIMKMMDTDNESRIRDLADLCFQRTLGNPFFVIEFMSMLQRKDLIQFNIGTMKWVYDVSDIEKATMSTANVVELVQSKMKKMPADVQLLLSISACLGPTFRVSILELVWRNLAYVESNGFEQDKVPVLIEFMEADMMIEGSFGDKYRWVHDKVQEAALSLLDVNEMTLKFEMGKILYLNLSGRDLDDELFDVADLISGGKGRESSADFASLCLKAATKALRLSAFLSSSRYIENGIAMLPNDAWISHQPLTLELYTLGAQVELELGHVAESKQYCSVVFEREDIDLNDKVPLKVVDIKRLSTVELNYADSIKTSLALLKVLKYKFRGNRPFIAFQALSLLSRTIKDIKRQPKDFYLRLGQMDKKQSTITEVLGRISYASSHTQEYMQMILCMCHIVQLTLKHGLCEQSAPNLALIGGLAIQLFKKHEDASRFREVALSTQSHFGRARACLTLFVVHVYSLSWSLQLENNAGPLFQCYIYGMQNGEVDIAMHGLNAHSLHIPYALGKPIDQVLEECPKVVMQAEEVSQTSQAILMKTSWQMFLNLCNSQQSQHSSLLKGEVHSFEACGEDLLVLGWHGFAEFQLLFFYDHPSAADKAIKSPIENCLRGYFLLMIDAFHRGVCLYVAAQRTKKRKYKQHARKIRNTMHGWKKVGNPNVVYYCIFLDAQHAALEGNYDEAEEHYKKAIQFVARCGYLHHAGLFNELYSEFLSRVRNDREEAKYRLDEAIRYYKEWGALGVVERIKRKV